MSKLKESSVDLSWFRRRPKEILLGENIDYYKLFYSLKKRHSTCYLFESLSSPRHQDRYYTIGFDPVLELIATGDQLRIVGKQNAIYQTFGVKQQTEILFQHINPYQFLQKNFPLQTYSSTHQGGLIGYFSYEAINYFEPSLQLKEHPDFPTFHFGLYLDGLLYDTETDLLYYYTYDQDRSAYIKDLIQEMAHDHIPTQLQALKQLGHSETVAGHAQAVQNTLAEIRAGNSFQSEVGFKTFYHIDGEKMAVYHKLRQINPSPYMFYLQFGKYELMGASPEKLVSSINRSVLTTPAAGTVQRGQNDQEDKALARKLLTDPKEIAEHNMLVDLHRNDISRVCEAGSVKVANLMYIIRFSHVQHIVSDIVGQLAKNKSAYDLLAAILPGGVVTGAPKIETIKIIDRNESQPRGPYGGAVGRFSLNGDAAFCLSIRSLFCNGKDCFTQTSSGVVYDSTVDQEYAEVRKKLAAMEQTLQSLAEKVTSNV
ncbi:anthranilate synthase component 1 [Seinonella peptonophila]|uniref:Anthranilate synthase component 1 n=1 Tax=Seinonella peptonophila TaxID=112248 RepID=A0A1M4X9K9_9BACL|nr:anthranilate synthase component I family protein [Seinonella peptonophila]SHE90199.1 anthranilate synthase component 1 [Seinonella peptonophila]